MVWYFFRELQLAKEPYTFAEELVNGSIKEIMKDIRFSDLAFGLYALRKAVK
jgi:hypothetical protein